MGALLAGFGMWVGVVFPDPADPDHGRRIGRAGLGVLGATFVAPPVVLFVVLVRG